MKYSRFSLDCMDVSEQEVRAHLKRILGSNGFANSARSCDFLRFCVDQVLEGNVTGIKESTLGVAVFGRAPDYDPKTDAIVRVHARRVRERLEEYYQGSGIEDCIEITIPKGCYVPVIAKRLPKPSESTASWRDLPPEGSAAPAQRTGHLHWSWLVIATCVSVALLAAMFGRWRNRPVTPAIHIADPVPFASFPGLEASPAWSPDGRTLAYTWDEDNSGALHIFLQEMGAAQPRRLTRDRAPELRPAWSPDGREIAFLRPAGSYGFDVVRHWLSDGAETTVAQLPYYSQQIGLPALDWSPDGKQFLVSEQPTPSSPVRLVLLNAVSGKISPLTQPVYGTSGDFEAKFSPDGSTIAFRRGGLGDLYTVPVQGEPAAQARRLTSQSTGIRGVAWSNDGKFIYFGGYGKNGNYSIYKISAQGGNPLMITPPDLQSTDPATSRDGRYIAFEHHDLVVNLVQVPIASPERKRYLSPSNQIDGSPSLSPDGRILAFISNRSGSTELWLQGMDGSGFRQITSFRGQGMPFGASWSPDGRSMVITVRAGGATNLYLYSLDHSNLRQITFGPDRIICPLFSSDGKSIYFSSNAEGETRIWRMASDGAGRPEQMYGDNAIYFQQSEDGRYLYFADKAKQFRLMRRNLKTGELDSIYASDRRLYSMASFEVMGHTLYMLLDAPKGSSADLETLDLANGSTKTLARLALGSRSLASGEATLIMSMAVTPDGQSIIVPEVRRANTDIYLMQTAEHKSP